MTTKKLTTMDPPATMVSATSLLDKALDKGLDVETMERLMNMAERQSAEVARQAWHAAMSRFQADCPPIRKRRVIPGNHGPKGHFASRADVMAQVAPVLADNALSLRYEEIVHDDGSIETRCHVMHVGGHSEYGSFRGPASAALPKASAYQEHGAAAEYRRRYALIDALAIVADTDLDAYKPPADVISDDQAGDLEQRMDGLSKAWVSKFLAYLGHNAIAEIRVDQLDDALNRIASAQKKRAAAHADS